MLPDTADMLPGQSDGCPTPISVWRAFQTVTML